MKIIKPVSLTLRGAGVALFVLGSLFVMWLAAVLSMLV
jgi:hypothetical protein